MSTPTLINTTIFQSQNQRDHKHQCINCRRHMRIHLPIHVFTGGGLAYRMIHFNLLSKNYMKLYASWMTKENELIKTGKFRMNSDGQVKKITKFFLLLAEFGKFYFCHVTRSFQWLFVIYNFWNQKSNSEPLLSHDYHTHCNTSRKDYGINVIFRADPMINFSQMRHVQLGWYS